MKIFMIILLIVMALIMWTVILIMPVHFLRKSFLSKNTKTDCNILKVRWIYILLFFIDLEVLFILLIVNNNIIYIMFFLLDMLMFVYLYSYKVIINQDSIEVKGLLKKKRTIRWDEIQDFKFGFSTNLILYFSNEKVIIHINVNNIRFLLDKLHNLMIDEKYLEEYNKIHKFYRSILINPKNILGHY